MLRVDTRWYRRILELFLVKVETFTREHHIYVFIIEYTLHTTPPPELAECLPSL